MHEQVLLSSTGFEVMTEGFDHGSEVFTTDTSVVSQCPDEFVVGYGLDYNEHYRSLPYIGVLRPECYA